MTIPGVGPLTLLYLVRTLGPVERFAGMRQVVSYVGLDSVERSSDNRNQRRRYGKISKQGDRMLRWLLVQSAVSATPFQTLLLPLAPSQRGAGGPGGRRPQAAGLVLGAAAG